MFKKLLVKGLSMAFIMVGLSTYAGYLMTGHLPAFMDRWRGYLPESRAGAAGQSNWSDIGALKHKETAPAGNYEVVQGGKTVIYKWQDANGHWQYGEHAPTAGSATKIEVATTPTTSSGPSTTSSPRSSESANSSTAIDRPELANPYSPEGVKQIMDKAHDVQRIMNQHNEQLGKE